VLKVAIYVLQSVKGVALLGLYQVRPSKNIFWNNKLIKPIETTKIPKQAVPFILLMDPDHYAIKDKFMMDKKNNYKYCVVGGSHPACARLDLVKENPHFDAVHPMQVWIVVGVSIQEATALAWSHNVDNEFRSSRTIIQRMIYLYMRYLGNNRKEDMATGGSLLVFFLYHLRTGVYKQWPFLFGEFN
jgi:hypothetical protein